MGLDNVLDLIDDFTAACPMPKYKLDRSDGVSLNDGSGHQAYRVVALYGFRHNVRKGSKGGYIESERNLSQTGDAWVYDNAVVSGNALVTDNASVMNNAHVSGNARITGHAQIRHSSTVTDNAQVTDNAMTTMNGHVSGNAKILGNADITEGGHVSGNAEVGDIRSVIDKEVSGDMKLYGTPLNPTTFPSWRRPQERIDGVPGVQP
jgi:hypothetical protein